MQLIKTEGVCCTHTGAWLLTFVPRQHPPSFLFVSRSNFLKTTGQVHATLWYCIYIEPVLTKSRPGRIKISIVFFFFINCGKICTRHWRQMFTKYQSCKKLLEINETKFVDLAKNSYEDLLTFKCLCAIKSLAIKLYVRIQSVVGFVVFSVVWF